MKEKILAKIRSLGSEWDGIKAKLENEKREVMTPEESARGAAINEELKQLRAQLETAKAMEEHEAWAEGDTRETPKTDPADEKGETRERPKVEVGKDLEAERPFGHFGEQLQAVHRAAVQAESGRGHMIDKRLLRLGEIRAASGASEGVGADGGYLVQTDFASDLLGRAWKSGLVSSKVTLTPIGPNSNGLKRNVIDETSRAEGSRGGGVQIYWANEADSATAKKPKLRPHEMTLQRIIGLAYATDELLQDATAMGAVITREFTKEFAFKIDDSIVNGPGAGQPLGILNSPALVTISKETNQAASTIVFDNVNKMWARALASGWANSYWFINQDTLTQMNQMAVPIGTGGVPVFLPPGGISDSPYSRLFGREVIPIEQCQTLGTVGDIILADLTQYEMISKGGLEAAQSVHVRFVNYETAFRFIYRCNGQPIDISPITPAHGSNTLSPFVALATRA